jgi:LruC domain-containing protein
MPPPIPLGDFYMIFMKQTMMIHLSKFTRLIFAVILLLTIVSGCKKEAETTAVKHMKDLVVPDQFNWNTSRTIQLDLSNIPAGIVRISSADGAVLYAKFLCNGVDNTQQLSLVLPSGIKSLLVNDYPVQLTGTEVRFTFPSAGKSAMTNNYAMNFNGTDGWIKVQQASVLTFTTQYSVSAWVRAGRQQTAKIVQKGDWDGLGLGQDLWNGWQTSVSFSDGTGATINWGAGQPVLNQWYHLVGMYDGNTVSLFVDGILRATETVSKTIRNNNRSVSIGADNGNQKFFQGLMDEVTIWTTAMTPEQVTTARAVGFTGGEPGLKGYWKFNEGEGTISFDGTPQQYNGENFNTLYNTEVGYNLTIDTDQDGVADTYDDYPDDNQRAFNNYLPSTGVTTVAFEDLWPTRGDYDFNDLVVSYTINTITSAQGKIVETYASFIVKAIGGSFRNGFGFNLPDCTIPSSAFTCTGSSLNENYISLAANGLENQQSKPTVIVFDNAYHILPGQSGVTGVNVEPGVPYVAPDTVTIHITYTSGSYTLNQLAMAGINPFLIINKTRGREVHMADFAPTSLADPSYFQTYDDDSQPLSGRYYKTENNLPWGISIPGNFEYPIEKQEITGAYLKLAEWALSGGVLFPDWYLDLPGYRDNSKIYH